MVLPSVASSRSLTRLYHRRNDLKFDARRLSALRVVRKQRLPAFRPPQLVMRLIFSIDSLVWAITGISS